MSVRAASVTSKLLEDAWDAVVRSRQRAKCGAPEDRVISFKIDSPCVNCIL